MVSHYTLKIKATCTHPSPVLAAATLEFALSHLDVEEKGQITVGRSWGNLTNRDAALETF